MPTKQDRWRQIDELFEAALERDTSARAAFLEAACGANQELRREVEELLRIDEQARDFIETPVFDVAARLMSLPSIAQAPSDASTVRHERPARESRNIFTSDSIDDARFVSGDVLAERYRIVGLLGRGGMGEVYRADDLRLKQPVALKFLPDKLSNNAVALARFYREVSVARQISHRHVCRIYDVGESAGQHFISMEYVRGEELASLLKRIGRLPADKATEIARQLCAGLAAIHDKGVLHRDLKPANVMIDERGDVRITDFGIAALADDAQGRETTAGTPAYMAPEQLEGRGASVRADIYALGLVLYEIFTGKRVFEAASLPELLALRRSDSTPTSPSSLVKDIDPLVERVILRCLERDPERRPATALQVAAALPGGDPLAAALAAGETPSPEMVAAAPKEGVLRPARAAALLAAVFVGIVVVMLVSGKVALHRLIPLKKSPDALKERADEIAKKFGYDAPTADTAHGFSLDAEHLFYLRDRDTSPDRWGRLATGQPPVVSFWYRQSPRYLEPYDSWEIDEGDPPLEVSGMVLVRLDTVGRLAYFEAVPPQLDEAQGENATPDWSVLFREAGLDMDSFQPTRSLWTPPQAYDARAAWDGTYSNQRDAPVRVEAASYRGRAVYFEIVNSWRAPTRQSLLDEGAADKASFALLLTFYFGTLLLGVLFAWRNLRLGRGDRRGAFRLALFVFAIMMVQWVFDTHHVPTVGEVAGLFLTGLGWAVYSACFIGVMYLALEPFLRRRRPEWLISWSRLLAGNFRDPLVGRDVLVGAALGVCLMLSFYLDILAPLWLGQPMSMPSIHSGLLYSDGLLGLNGFVPLLVAQVYSAILQTFIVAFILLFFTMLLRNKWLGIAAGWLLLAALSVLAGDSRAPVSMLVNALVPPTLVVLAVTRFGLLTLITALIFVHLVVFFPVTTELSAWYARSFILNLIVLAALAVYGFYTSLAGQPLFGGKFLED